MNQSAAAAALFGRFVSSGQGEYIFRVTCVREKHTYIFRHVHRERAEALRTMGRWACNPDLNFTWCDAAQCSILLREITRKVKVK